MGRVKTQLIKRITMDILEGHGAEFKKSFKENKEVLDKIADIPSVKIRNAIAGYITRLMKTKE